MKDRSSFGDRHNTDPFEIPSPWIQSPGHCGPTGISRVIGALLGGFVFCFASILLTLPILFALGEGVAGVLWILGLLVGAVGGALFPRIGYFLAYTFVVFMNICLCLTIGRNLREQVTFFAIFLFIEVVFFICHVIVQDRRKAT